MNYSSDNTGQKGVNAVEAIFLDMGWIFRRQLESDFGIDAQVEIVENSYPTGKLIGLQIKCGRSFFRKRGKNYVFRGEARHLKYWENYSLPVILVLHDPESGLTLWRRIQRHDVTNGKNESWSIEIVPSNILTEKSNRNIIATIPSSYPDNIRRQRIALSADLIRKIAEVDSAYLVIHEWVNKSANFRGASIEFDNPDGNEDVHNIPFLLPAKSITNVFDLIFPWLNYSYDQPPNDDDCEVTTHTFHVELNTIGKAFLTLEDFYHNGPKPSAEPEIPAFGDLDTITEEDLNTMTEEEWIEYRLQKEISKDSN